VVDNPGYLGYCDASKLGAGGVWLLGTRKLSPIVWRVEWSKDIRRSVVSFENPNGTITNSDLEMAGMRLHYLVLEHLVHLNHVHVAAWCDNTPTVSWTNKLSSSRSAVAGHLTRALTMRIHTNEASHSFQSPSLASTRTHSARPLQARYINALTKSGVSLLGLDKKGFPPESVSSDSLRAGGGMAMHLNDIDRDKIWKQGRWSSDTFLMYIHEQIPAFSTGLAMKMLTEIGSHNIEGPTLTEPAAAA
jgi:hypothetical protein